MRNVVGVVSRGQIIWAYGPDKDSRFCTKYEAIEGFD